MMKKAHSLLFTTAFLLLLFCQTPWAGSTPAVEHPGESEIVVLLHGLGRSNLAMWLLAQRIENAGYHVERIGYSSLNVTPQEILEEVTSQIDSCCAHHQKPVHYVGHSLGGLLIRAYLQEKRPDNIGRVVLMGTPNQGTPIVDAFRDKWWMKFLGPTTSALGTENDSFPGSLEAPFYPVGVIAGVANTRRNDAWLPGPDDGLVTVEATKLEGMSDFIVIRTGHSFMRYDQEVARQTVSFLRDGRFSRQQGESRVPGGH
jgi:pimeloyl-ACP methyl ester carboxylesterase